MAKDVIAWDGEVNFSQQALKKAAQKIKSALSNITIPINVNVTKKSLGEAQRTIKTYFAQSQVPINIIISKKSLVDARRQLQSSLSAVSLPQITVNPKTARALRSITNTLSNLTNSTNNAVAAAISGRGVRGGGGGGRGSGRGASGASSDLPLGRLSGEASEFSKSMDAATARVFAFGATAVVLNTVTQSFRRLVLTSIEVEKRLTEIQAIAGSTDEEFGKFRDTIFDVAANTGQTFTTVADGAAELARQGLSATEITERLNASLLLTRISGLAAEDSVGALTAVINGFASAGLNAEEIVNKIVAVDTAFAVSAKDLADGFTRAGSTAEDAGLTFDELLGLITAIQQRTQRGGAVIGNALKTIFTRIGSSKTIEDLKALGVQIDASQTGIEKLKALSDAFEQTENDPIKGTQIKELAGGKYQINIVSAALKDLANSQSLFTKATQESNNATDEAERRNDELNKSTSARINALIASLTNLSDKIGQVTFAPILKSAVDDLNKVSGSLSKALNPTEGFNLTRALFEGIGTFVSGPGSALVIAAFSKIFALVIGFAKEGFQEISKINVGLGGTAKIQERINAALIQNDALYQRIEARVKAGATIRFSTAARVAAFVNKEIEAAQRRLQIEQQITAELKKRGAFIDDVGRIAFDKNARAKAGRIARNVAASPATSLVASFGISAGANALDSSFNSSAVQAESLTIKLAKLKEEFAGLNEETDKERFSAVKKEIAELNKTLDQTTKEAEGFSAKIDKISSLLSGLLFVAGISGFDSKFSKLLGKGGLAGAVGFGAFELGKFIQKQLGDPIGQAADASILGEFSNDSNFRTSMNSTLREFDKLQKAIELLSTEIIVNSGKISSGLQTLDDVQTSFNKDIFGGIKSNVDLNKRLGELLEGSSIERAKKRGTEIQNKARNDEARFELLSVINDISIAAKKNFDEQAKGLGFADSSKVISGSLVGRFGQTLDEIRNSLLEAKDVGFNSTNNLTTAVKGILNETVLNTSASTEEEILILAKELTKLKPVRPELASIGEDIIKFEASNDLVKAMEESSKIIRRLSDGAGLASSEGSVDFFREVIDEFKGLEKFIPIEELDKFKDSYKEVLSQFGANERERILEDTKLKLSLLEKEDELNKKFLEELKSIYDENITSVRDLRGSDIGNKLPSNFISDPFSEFRTSLFENLGVSGSNQAPINNARGALSFGRSLLGDVSGGFRSDLNRLSAAGVPLNFSQSETDLRKEQLKNIDISDNIEKAFANVAQKRLVGTPFAQSLELLRGAKNQEELQKAIQLQEQGLIGLSKFNVKPGSQQDAEIQGILVSLAQATKLTKDIVRTRNIGAFETAGENEAASIETKAKTVVESELASTENLEKGLSIVGTILVEDLAPKISTIGAEFDGAEQHVKSFANALAEKAKELSSIFFKENLESFSAATFDLSRKTKDVALSLEETTSKIRTEGDSTSKSLSAIPSSMDEFKKQVDLFTANVKAMNERMSGLPQKSPEIGGTF